MKLAEALLERKSLMSKVENLRERLSQNVLVQEGDAPTEQPESLLQELSEVIAQLEVIIKRINATNNVARLADGVTISEAIVRRDMLTLRRVSFEMVTNTATVRQNRYTRAEVRFVSTINAAELRKELDAVAKACRELDAQIQATNWSTDLVE